MEADQHQEVPEALAESQAMEKEPLVSEQPKEVEQATSEPIEVPPKPTEVEEPHVKLTDPKIPIEKVPEVAPAEAKVPDIQPVKVTEAMEAAAPMAEVAQEKASEEQEEPAESENKVVGQNTTDQVESEKKAEATEKPTAQPEQKAEAEDAKKAEVAAANEAESVEKTSAPTAEVELEKPSEAEEVQAELPKEEAAQQPNEPEIPEFFGWFLLSEVEERIKCSTMDFLKTLDTLEAFKKHLSEFTGEAEKEVDLEQYFQTKGPLHCTTKFCDYGKAEGAKEYAEQQVVKDSYGSSAELSVVALIVTPRTFGGRVDLTQEQLQLWPAGADKQGVPETSLPAIEALPVGSRAHVTLGCAMGVEAVQTGLDLLEILCLQKESQEPLAKEELELGTLSYLGQGSWYLTLREAVTCDTTFSSYSEDKKPSEPAKKEGGEKKKKPKCSIL